MVTLHPAGFTHGPHPKALKNMLTQAKPATDEVAVMIDARDALEITTPRAQSNGRAMSIAGAAEARHEARQPQGRRARWPARRSRIARSRTSSPCPNIAPTLQSALDQWSEVEPLLRDVAAAVEAGKHARRPALRPARMRGASAARIPLGRRQRLRESRRARAQSARRRDARSRSGPIR